jgi:hypothetical protein
MKRGKRENVDERESKVEAEPRGRKPPFEYIEFKP